MKSKQEETENKYEEYIAEFKKIKRWQRKIKRNKKKNDIPKDIFDEKLKAIKNK
jgi:hypothetical protein